MIYFKHSHYEIGPNKNYYIRSSQNIDHLKIKEMICFLFSILDDLFHFQSWSKVVRI